MKGIMILAAVTVAAGTIDLSPILDPLIQLAGLVLTGVVGWATLRVAQQAHLNTKSTALAQLLGAVDRGITFATNSLQSQADLHDKITVQSAVQAQAADYVITKMPGTLKTLGIDVTTAAGKQHVADLVLAKLPPTQ